MFNAVLLKWFVLVFTFSNISHATQCKKILTLRTASKTLPTIAQVLFEASRSGLSTGSYPGILSEDSGQYKVPDSERKGEERLREYVASFDSGIQVAFRRQFKDLQIDLESLSQLKESLEIFSYRQALYKFIFAIAVKESLLGSNTYFKSLQVLSGSKVFLSIDEFLLELERIAPSGLLGFFNEAEEESWKKWFDLIKHYRSSEGERDLIKAMNTVQDRRGGDFIIAGYRLFKKEYEWRSKQGNLVSITPYVLYKMILGELRPVSQMAVDLGFNF